MAKRNNKGKNNNNLNNIKKAMQNNEGYVVNVNDNTSKIEREKISKQKQNKKANPETKTEQGKRRKQRTPKMAYVETSKKNKKQKSDNKTIPSELQFEYDKDRDRTHIIDKETGEVLHTFKRSKYKLENKWHMSRFKKYYDSDYKNSFEGLPYTYTDAIIDVFKNECKKLRNNIADRVIDLIEKSEQEQGRNAVAFALNNSRELLEICLALEFSSDASVLEFSSQFLALLPNASDQWIKDTMDELEYHEGVFEDGSA